MAGFANSSSARGVTEQAEIAEACDIARRVAVVSAGLA